LATAESVLTILGTIQYRQWTDADGTRHCDAEILAREIHARDEISDIEMVKLYLRYLAPFSSDAGGQHSIQ
jgi:single-stranded DNA-binding protein